MADGFWLRLELDWWDNDSVAAFEPTKVVRRLRRAFATAEINPADAQRERLEFELARWEQVVTDPAQNATMVQSTWSLYARAGPAYRFVVPLVSGVSVAGSVSRMAVTFKVPSGTPKADEEPLTTFLHSLGLGKFKRLGPMRVDVPASAARRVYPPATTSQRE